ncbi:RNA polymerase I-specific transcription-initiation factor-domain-containing protein [Xylariales sp. AK1849]|nr:RNA polymerase I-specific transcription-initiation factor-domain-containing protein [Xylariales sp. AK1849]
MADRRYNQSTFGNPGRLKYLPHGIQQTEDCGWQTVRDHDVDVPKFMEIGPHHEWLTASHAPISTPSKDTWHETQKQKKWLLKNHPEAALGNNGIGELPAVGNSLPQHGQVSSWQLTQFAVGELADTSDAGKTSGVPLLAMAAGSAGDVLRLIRLSAGAWQLRQDNSITLQLLDHATYQETLWTKDIGTIRRVQTVVSSKRFEPVRWLIVQRDLGTTVFRPEYQKVPVVSETFSATGPQPPSHIAPNPLFTLSKSDTGCDAHSDVAFNPGIKSKPPQLAIIDEGGHWTIWDISGTRNRTYKRPKLRLSMCGSIRKGVQEKKSRRLAMEPQWHRVLWVGHSKPDDEYDAFDEEDDSKSQTTTSFPPLDRSSTLLQCNQKMLRLLDLETSSFLPDLSFIPKGSNDVILDVHADVQDPRYFYIVTTSMLFVAAVLPTTDPAQTQNAKKASILQSFPHLRSQVDRSLKVAVTAGPPSLSDRISLVFLYSRNSSWHDIFCVRFSKKQPERISCHHETLISRGLSSTHEDLGLQTLYISPIPLLPLGDRSTPIQPIKYYQMFSFGMNLSLSHCLSASSVIPWDRRKLSIQKLANVEGPDSEERKGGLYATRSAPMASQDIQRRKAIRYLSSRFVVADSVAMFQFGNESLVTTNAASMSTRKLKPLRRMVQPVWEYLQNFVRELGIEGYESSIGMDIFGAAPFDPVFITLQTALETKNLPLKSLFELVPNLRIPRVIDEISEEWHDELEQLERVDSTLGVRSLVKLRSTSPNRKFLHDLFTGLLELTPGAPDISYEFTNLAVRRIACELYLSGFGIMYLPPGLSEPQPAVSRDTHPPTHVTDDMLIDSQESDKSTVLSPNIPHDSQASSRASTPASSAPSVPAKPEGGEDTEDRSGARLRVFTGYGTPIPQKTPNLLSMWSEGADPASYSFSINNNTEITPGMQRRAKQEAREARKRKRAETLLQLQQEHNIVPSTQPVLDNRSFSQASQPLNDFSSQIPAISSASAITMSQPVAGAFGGRTDSGRSKKKSKRKGGF